MSKKILKHQDKEEIIRLLTDGESVRDVEKHLKDKYPDDKGKHVSFVTLQSFRKQHLNLEGKVLRDIQEATSIDKQKVELMVQQRQIESSDAYKNKINAIASDHLDVQTQIIQLNAVVENRIEYWYNMIASGEELPAKADNELRKYVDQQINILHQYKKMVEGMADKTVDHNINVTVMNDQIGVIRDVIKETIAELGTEKAMIFMDRLNKRLSQTTYRPENLRTESVDIRELQAMDAEILGDDNV